MGNPEKHGSKVFLLVPLFAIFVVCQPFLLSVPAAYSEDSSGKFSGALAEKDPAADSDAAVKPSSQGKIDTEDFGEGEATEQYIIKSDDILEVKMFPDEEKEISGDYKVRKSGTISFPLLGEVEAAGLAEEELAQKLTFLLEKDYYVFPQVNLRVKEYHKSIVVILGEVKQPGTYEVETQTEFTLLRAISLAGGFTDIAKLSNIKIIRKVGGAEKSFMVNAEEIINGRKKDVRVKENDVIVVGESFF
ncbi:MAG: polysaccharide export protein [Candidatus Omnitrophica bacterium]|nr:polysaccharide export protein [Candidatus Omnitrophota bacterium]